MRRHLDGSMWKICAGPLAALLLAPTLGRALDIGHSGHLLDGSDLPVLGNQSMEFRIFPGVTGGVAGWTSGACPVSVQGGRYAVRLGADCGADVPATVFAGGTAWLEVQIGAVILSPRLALAPVPVASRSLDAQQLRSDLSTAGTLNEASNPVDWSRLKGVPAAFADGTDDGRVYSAAPGGGLTVDAAGQFSLSSDAASLARVSGGSLSVSGSVVTAVSLSTTAGVVIGTSLSASTLSITGNATIGGALSAATLSGDGAGVTNVDAAKVGGKSLADLQSMFAPSTGGMFKAPTSAVTCDASATGSMYFDTTLQALRICANNTWTTLVSVADGSSSGTAAASCAAVKQAKPGSSNGLFWVQSTPSAVQVYCDFTSNGTTTTLPAFFANASLGYYYDLAKVGGYDFKRAKDLSIPAGRVDASKGVNINGGALSSATNAAVPYTYGRTVVVRARRALASASYGGFMFSTQQDDDGLSIWNGGLGTRTHGGSYQLQGTMLDNVMPSANTAAGFSFKVHPAGATFYSASSTYTPTNVGPGSSYDSVAGGYLWIGSHDYSVNTFSGGDFHIERFAVFNAEMSDSDARAFAAQINAF